MYANKTTPFNTNPTYNEFSNPRLIAIYETVNSIAKYKTFYLELAVKLSAAQIIDIGCGTGLLTYELANRGHNMIGLEPASAMIDIARQRTYNQKVQWIEGNVSKLTGLQADLAIMTGHVAQFFLDDESWHKALKTIHKVLRPGGHIAFESRNPIVQPWADDQTGGHIDWPSSTSRRKVHDPRAGLIEWWMQLIEVKGDLVRYENHYFFTKSGEELVSVNELKFRTQTELKQSLENVGFSVENVFGNWDSSPVSSESPELIFVATR